MDKLEVTLPDWFHNLPEEEQARMRAKLIMRVLAVVATPEGTIAALSSLLGLNRNSLNAMIANGSLDNGIPVNIVKSIEKALGTGVISRKVLNPFVYGDE